MGSFELNPRRIIKQGMPGLKPKVAPSKKSRVVFTGAEDDSLCHYIAFSVSQGGKRNRNAMYQDLVKLVHVHIIVWLSCFPSDLFLPHLTITTCVTGHIRRPLVKEAHLAILAKPICQEYGRVRSHH